jgi:hypothetical protein
VQELQNQDLGVAGTREVDELSKFFSGLAEKLFSASAPVIRIGVVGLAVQAFKSQTFAVQQMRGEIPFGIELPEGVEDFGIQFNIHSLSRAGVQLNNLHVWQTLKQQFFKLSGTGIQLSESIITRETLDVNTSQVTSDTEILGEEGRDLLVEIIEIVADRFRDRIK